MTPRVCAVLVLCTRKCNGDGYTRIAETKAERALALSRERERYLNVARTFSNEITARASLLSPSHLFPVNLIRY